MPNAVVRSYVGYEFAEHRYEVVLVENDQLIQSISGRSVPMTRSASAFARGDRTGVAMALIPIRRARWVEVLADNFNADGSLPAATGIRARLRRGPVLEDRGDIIEVEDSDRQKGMVRLRSYSCPLAAVVSAHPEVCRMMESLLGCDRRPGEGALRSRGSA